MFLSHSWHLDRSFWWVQCWIATIWRQRKMDTRLVGLGRQKGDLLWPFMKEKRIKINIRQFWIQIKVYRISQKVAFDGNHNVIEILGWNKSRAFLILRFESNLSIFVMEVMQKLGKFRIRDDPVFVLSEIELGKIRSLQGKRDRLVEGGFLDDFAKLFEAYSSTSISVKELESSAIHGIWHTQPPLKRVELLKWN